jgi:enoyl-CoA hydratase
MSTEGRISIERRGHLLLMGLDRAAKMNAFDLAMLDGLAAAYAQMDSDDEVRCGVLFAHGDHFTAGLDLLKVAPRFAAGDKPLGDGPVDPLGVHGAPRAKPVVAALQGRCLTIGIELALSCDIVVAAVNTRFGQIEIRRGIFPFGGATMRMPAAFGWGNAMRWLLTGDEFDAREAHRLGLVQEVVPVGQQLERAIALGDTIAQQAPLGVRATLRNARLAVTDGPEAAARALLPELRALLASDDAREGMASFAERRAARFTGK